MIIRSTATIYAFSFLVVLLFFHEYAEAYEFPPYEGLTLKITGNISESYSNNVTFASDNENRIKDYMTMLALGMDLQYERKRYGLGFDGDINRRIRTDSSDIENSSENIYIYFNNKFSKYDNFRIENRFVHTQVPGREDSSFDMDECRKELAEQGKDQNDIENECNEFAAEFGRFRGRFDSYSNSLSFHYNINISEDISMNTYYTYGQNWSSEEGTDDSDRTSTGLSANYIYNPATSFQISYNYNLSSYENGEDIFVHSVTVGIRQYLTKRVSLYGKIGQIYASTGNSNISIDAGLNSEIDERTSTSLSYSKGVRINDNDDDVFRNWQLRGTVQRILSEDMSGSLSAFYGKGDFVSSDITDTLFGTRCSLSYSFWRGKRGSSLRGSLGYAFSKVNSTNEDREYTRNSVTSSITLAF